MTTMASVLIALSIVLIIMVIRARADQTSAGLIRIHSNSPPLRSDPVLHNPVGGALPTRRCPNRSHALELPRRAHGVQWGSTERRMLAPQASLMRQAVQRLGGRMRGLRGRVERRSKCGLIACPHPKVCVCARLPLPAGVPFPNVVRACMTRLSPCASAKYEGGGRGRSCRRASCFSDSVWPCSFSSRRSV